VFWGMIQATGTMRGAGLMEQTILTTTNTERTKRGLPELTPEQVKHSLFKLEQLGSIARMEGDTYRLVEQFKVKS
jgi:hypothetical protein